jgi:type VI secretion system protein ImpC
MQTATETNRGVEPGVMSKPPGPLLAEILAETRIVPTDDAYHVAKQGVSALVGELLQATTAGDKVDRALVDCMIAEIDARLSAQTNAILHHPQVQHLESAWRGLKTMVDRTDFRENIKVEVLNVSRDDLQADFDDAPEVSKSGLYRLAYANEYGVFGGEPYGLLVGNYDFGPGGRDMQLLSQCAAVAAMAHAPFITNADPQFFGASSFEALPRLKDLQALLEGPQYAKWHSFRDTEDSRYVGLCLPRFLLRLPYGAETIPVKAFDFSEDVVGVHENYLWGHASIALATRIADSFAKSRWCLNIIGPQAGGAVADLPLHTFAAMGEMQNKIPTEVLLTERREYELSEEGFIGLTFRKDSDNACFFSANSAQRPKAYAQTPEGLTAATNYRLGTQLPYLFVITRLSHYVKVMQREQLGSYKDKVELQRELNNWIRQYVADMEDPAPGVRARRPLRKAHIEVSDVEGQPGWYRCRLEVQPHLKYMGATFTLSLTGRLDKE